MLISPFGGLTQNNDSTSTIGKDITGKASFYALKFEGRKTASGEIFSHKKLTAASNHFKLGTWVKVTMIKTKKSVVVKINDRMSNSYTKRGRIIDLSRAAAIKIGLIKRGIGLVRVQELTNYPD